MTSDLRLTSDIAFATPDDKPATFAGVAYTGAVVTANGFGQPIVVDLAGLEIPDKAIPVLRGHDHDRVIGHATVSKSDTELTIDGVVSGSNAHADEIVASSKKGMPWQLSIGSSILKTETLGKGKTATVNGRPVSGPIIIARQSRLNEVSYVPVGADRNTSVHIAAKAKTPEGKQMPEFETVAKEIEAGNARVEALELTAAKYPNAPAKLLEAAIADESVSIEKFELECLRASRPSGITNRHSGGSVNLTGQVLEAAICQSLGVAEKQFSDEVNQQAHAAFKGRVGLKQLLFRAAAANGQHFDSTADLRGLLKAAFGGQTANFSGFSTLDIADVLSNVQNKSLVDYYNSVEQSWRTISAVSSVSDFKAHVRYSMTGDLTFRPVAKGGEISHGTLGNDSRSISAATQAIMLAVTREDIVNDDLSALSRVPQRMGRGAALAINRDFYAEYLDDATFYSLSNGNLITTALTEAGLDEAEEAFYAFRDPDGNPMGIQPTTLLVPPALRNTALRLMNSVDVVGQTDRPSINVYQGRYNVVVSQYLTDANNWYLLASPLDMPTVEVAFLNGKQLPTIESTDADFNVLGIQTRGYFDYGVAKMEYRGGVKAAVA